MKFYAWLLKLYPARFREEYSSPMERQFRDDYRDAGNGFDKMRLWLRALSDLASTIPGQTLSEVKLDVKGATRIYRRRSPSMLFAVAALGLAIGVSTGVFSVISALLIRDLPFSEPSRLVELWFSPFNAMEGRATFTSWQRQGRYLDSATTFSSSDMNATGSGQALRVKVAETSANFFQVLGSEAVLGRTFSRDEDVFGRNQVAVISYGLWQQLYGGDDRVLGTSLHLDGTRLTIIGVMPVAFDYPGKVKLWTPTVFNLEFVPKRGAFMFQTIGRLKAGVSLRKAEQYFDAEIWRRNPTISRNFTAGEPNRPHLGSLQNRLAGPVRQAIWVLAGLTSLLLLTASANVAQLLLSRAIERRPELELRAALGASRARLLQQLVTEAILLTMLSAALGLVVAQWTCRLASSVSPPQLSTQAYTVFDWRVLVFAGCLAILMGLLFGFVPAFSVGRLHPSELTIRTLPGTHTSGTRRTRAILIGLQAALTLSLLISSFTVGRTFLNLLHTDLGFWPESVVTLTTSLQGTTHQGAGEWHYYSKVLNRLSALPGVKSASAVNYLPLGNDIYMAESFKLDSGQTIRRVVMNSVAPGYFRAIGTPFLGGTDFTARMTPADHPVIVNEAFAERAHLGNLIVGHTLTVPWNGPHQRVVGVVKSVRFAGPAYPGEPQIYFQVQEEPPAALTFVAQVSGNPEAYLSEIRDAVRSLDPKVPVYDVKTLDSRLEDSLARPRFYSTATAVLSLLALLLAIVGVYGTTAYTISQQRHEVGIRLAIGASHRRVRLAILYGSLAPLIGGAIAGIFISAVTGGLLQHLLEYVPRPSVWIYAAASVLLLVIGLAACWISTGKVLSIDPASALRSE